MTKVAEAELRDACRAGAVLDCADGSGDDGAGDDGAGGPGRRTLDARLIRRYCHDLKDRVDPRGIRVRNAEVVGALDLAGFDVPFPLRFDGCSFDTAPQLEGAQLHGLALTGCPRLPGLLANGVRIRRDLDLSGSSVTGGHWTSASRSKPAAVWLCESEIGGRVLCVDTVIRPDGGRAIHADRMHVGGTIRLLHDFVATGEVRLLGVRVDGSIDLGGVRIDCPDGVAVELSDAVVGGSIFLVDDPAGQRPLIRGRVDLWTARISGQVLVRNATLEPPAAPPVESYARRQESGTALSCPRLFVGAELTVEGTCDFAGGIDLALSDLGGLTVDGGCRLRAPGRTALNLTNAELRASLRLAPGVEVEGTVRLTGARIHGSLTLQDVALRAPQRTSLVAAQGLAVDGDVELQKLRTTGGAVRLRSSTLGGVVDLAGAHLDNPDEHALTLHQATVGGSVRLVDGFTSTGFVSLARSTVEGRLDCTDGSFHCPGPSARNPGGHAIIAMSATFRGGMYLGWRTVTPSVDFTDATTAILADDPAHWPPGFVIAGLSYDRLARWDSRPRRDWLRRQSGYDSGPYEQAARVFRQHGYVSGAEDILIAQRVHARHAGPMGRTRRTADALYGWSVRYGYRPGRVFWALVVLLALVAGTLAVPAVQATFRAADPQGVVYVASGRRVDQRGGNGCRDGQVRCFNPVVYAVDTVVPLVALGQRGTWYPAPDDRLGRLVEWWLDAATLLGWLLSSILVLSFARLSRNV